MIMMDCRPRSSPQQLAALIDFMEKNGHLIGTQKGLQGRIIADRLWRQLTHLLNSVAGGVSRNTENWKKIWADWKTKTKKKAALLKKKNVSGNFPLKRLTAVEQRLLAVMEGTVVVSKPLPLVLTPHVQTPPVQTTLVQTPPVQTLPVQTPPVQTPPVQTPPVQTPPVQAPPVQTPPVQAPPVQTPPPACAVQGLKAEVSPSLNRARPFRVLQVPRRMTPFEEATTQFYAIELQRLKLEEARLELEKTRENNLHEREMKIMQIFNEHTLILKNINQGINYLIKQER